MSAPPAAPAPAPFRLRALDILRGVAILLMCLSGRVPFGELALPAWMYHAQNPPPSGALNTAIAGYTWVDLVFPMFLFSMGVAIPIALSGRMARGLSGWRVGLGALGRMGALLAFAIYFQHVTPGVFTNGTATTRALVALLAFAIPFAVYTRLPDGWPAAWRWGLRAAGIAAAAALLASLTYRELRGTTAFSLYRSNIILVVLANMAFFGSVGWMLTRGNTVARLALMGVLTAALLAAVVPGSWLAPIVAPPFLGQSLAWAYNFTFLKYLLIVLAATLTGERLLVWVRERPAAGDALDRTGLLALASLLLAAVVFAHVGLQARWTMATPFGLAVLMGAAWWLCPAPTTSDGRLLRWLHAWSMVWMLIGLLCEPVDGGIKKSPAGTPYNFSYYFVSLALSQMCLMMLVITADLLGWRRGFGALNATGQNPMLAYLGINNLVEPLFTLTGLNALAPRVLTTPWAMGAFALAKTVVLALLTALFTRWRLVWRS